MILALIPLIWSDKVGLEIVKFTKEWYESWFQLLLIVFSFILINCYWENLKNRKEKVEKEVIIKGIWEQWKPICSELQIEILNIRTNGNKWNEEEKKKILDILCSDQSQLLSLSIRAEAIPILPTLENTINAISLIKSYRPIYAELLNGIIKAIEDGSLYANGPLPSFLRYKIDMMGGYIKIIENENLTM